MIQADFTAKSDEKFVDGKPYCLKCGEPRFFESPDGKMLVRALCRCECEEAEKQDKDLKTRNWLERFAELDKINIIKNRYENAYFGGLDINRPTDFLDAVKKVKTYTYDFLNGKKQNLFIYGKVGLGKTQLIACVYNKLKQKQIPVVFTSFMEIIKYIISSFDDEDLESRQTFEKLLATVDLLIIDDLGVEYIKSDNSFANEIIYNIVNGRYIRNKPTIYTSNFALNELKYQERIIDRIAESKIKIHLEQGETYRKNKFLKEEIW